MKPIFILFGAPGSGKTWIMNQLGDKFTCLPHDSFLNSKISYEHLLAAAARTSSAPILADSPFKVNSMIDELRTLGAEVRPYFILEPESTVRARYRAREGKSIPAGHITRISSLAAKAQELNAPRGTSEQVLALLRAR